MPNHRLRSALSARSLTAATLASKLEVDPKTVERWVSTDRIPRASTRSQIVRELGYDETYFWPSLLGGAQAVGATSSEIEQTWPTRAAIPGDVWHTLINDASRIEVLVYAATFLIDTYRLGDALLNVSNKGGKARLLLGDSQSPALAQRGLDEGLPNVPGRAASALEYLQAQGVPDSPGVELRLHDTPLYASLYRFDDVLLVNPHTHGLPAKDSPVLKLSPVPGGHLFDYYARAFERVWEGGRALG